MRPKSRTILGGGLVCLLAVVFVAYSATEELKTAAMFPVDAAHDCPKTIVVREPEGAIVMVLSRSEEKEELVTRGAEACGPWSPWGLYADECRVLTSRMRSRNCSRTNVYQKKHICLYRPSAAWVGWVGYAQQSHDEGDPYNKTTNWIEEEFDYAFGSWGHIFATNATLREAITSITTGKERTVDYTDKRATAVVGAPFSVAQDSTIPTQIGSIRYLIDGREVTPGKPTPLGNVGESTAMAEIRTRSGGVVKFVVPLNVIRPVTIEETIRRELGNGEVQYDIKIRNNNKTHPSLAWVSVSPFDRTGFSADLKGPTQYLLPAGDSAMVSVIARPTSIRPANRAQPPGVFDLIVTSPTGGGVIGDTARLTVSSALPASAKTASVETANGLHTASFDTIHGQVIVKVTDDATAGDTISGTVIVDPKGNTEEERKNNADKLSELKLNFGAKFPKDKKELMIFITPRVIIKDEAEPSVPNRASFTTKLPETFDYTIGLDAPRTDTATVTITINSMVWFINNQPTPTSVELPTLGQAGRLNEVLAPLDGNAANTDCKIGGQDVKKVAESRWKLVFESPPNVIGQTDISFKEGNVEAKGEYTNVGVRLTARKQMLREGESTTLTCTFDVGPAPRKPVPAQLTAEGVITMEGGPFQQFTLDRTSTISRRITGNQTGGWSATASIVTTPYNIVLRDPDPPQTLLFNSFTGDYIFCSPQGKFSGTAQVQQKGCTAEINSRQKDHEITGPLNICVPVDNSRNWSFYSPGTTVDFNITATATRIPRIKIYANPLGKPAPPVQDTSAFATCP